VSQRPHSAPSSMNTDYLFERGLPAEIVMPRLLLQGDGSVELLGGALRGLDIPQGPVLLVADSTLIELARTGTAEQSLTEAGYECVVRSQAPGEPTLAASNDVVAAVRDTGYVAVVGLGGGSAMDSAKLAAGLATNPGCVDDYIRGRQIAHDSLPLVLVPTTAGTGAEASRNTIVNHENCKFVIGSARLVPIVAILDPVLTATCPPGLTAASGMDALAHAVESALSLWANSFTTLNGLAAIQPIARWLRPAYEDGNNVVARRALLYSAYHAGLALNAATLLGHSMAYTIATRTKLPHGVTTGMSLAYCVAYNAPGARGQIEALATQIHIPADDLAEWVHRLAVDVGLPGSLEEVGIKAEDIPDMVEDCLVTYPRPNNPVPFTRQRLSQLYRHFFDGDIVGAVEAMS